MQQSILNWKTRRALTDNHNATAEELAKAGQELMQADMLVEAADLLAKGTDIEGLRKVRTKSMEEGNYFLYARICQLLKTEQESSELKTLADNAGRLGLSAYEKTAREMLAAL
jgi:hypothetical protein